MNNKEIAKIICKECSTHKKDCTGGKANLPCLMAEFCGEAVYNAGYRKLPKDSVVLSREEYETLLNQNKGLKEENGQLRLENNDLEAQYENAYEQAEQNVLANIADGGTSCHWCIEQHEKIGYEKGSKNTAEKVLNDIADLEIVDNKVCAYELASKLNKLEKQFGVEIEE